jgi:hypothetical protein
VQELPGGGQTGIEGAATPPAAPPADPQLVVTTARASGAEIEVWNSRATLMERWLELMEDRWSSSQPAASAAADLRLATFRSLWGQAVERLLALLARSLSADRSLALLLRVPGS